MINVALLHDWDIDVMKEVKHLVQLPLIQIWKYTLATNHQPLWVYVHARRCWCKSRWLSLGSGASNPVGGNLKPAGTMQPAGEEK